METACPRCSTRYSVELPAQFRQAPAKPMRFRCSHCGHNFSLQPSQLGLELDALPEPPPPARPGVVLPPPSSLPIRFVRREGRAFQVPDLAALQRWVVEGRVLPQDELSADGITWQLAVERGDLQVFFAAASQLVASSLPASHAAPPLAAPPVAAPPVAVPAPLPISPEITDERAPRPPVAPPPLADLPREDSQEVPTTISAPPTPPPDLRAAQPSHARPAEPHRAMDLPLEDTQEAPVLPLPPPPRPPSRAPTPPARMPTPAKPSRLPSGPSEDLELEMLNWEAPRSLPPTTAPEADPELPELSDAGPSRSGGLRVLMTAVALTAIAALAILYWQSTQSPGARSEESPDQIRLSGSVEAPGAPEVSGAPVETTPPRAPASPDVLAPAEPPPEKPSEQPSEEPVGAATEKPAEKPVEKTAKTEKATAATPATKPAGKENYVKKGWESAGSGDYQGAWDSFNTALSSGGGAMAYYGRGYAAEKLGRLDSALSDYCTALSQGSNNTSLVRDVEGSLRRLRRTCP